MGACPSSWIYDAAAGAKAQAAGAAPLCAMGQLHTPAAPRHAQARAPARGRARAGDRGASSKEPQDSSSIAIDRTRAHTRTVDSHHRSPQAQPWHPRARLAGGGAEGGVGWGGCPSYPPLPAPKCRLLPLCKRSGSQPAILPIFWPYTSPSPPRRPPIPIPGAAHPTPPNTHYTHTRGTPGLRAARGH